MLLLFTLFYYTLAKTFSQKLKIHSILHCISATLLNTYSVFYFYNINLMTLEFCNYNLKNTYWTGLATYNSLGYFISDSLDILSDWQNIKRRVFLIHHIFAILGLLVSFSDSILTNYAIWSLEIGGLVHHLKHASEFYNFSTLPYTVSHILYFTVYIISRLLFFINCSNCLLYSDTSSYEKIGIFISYALIFQNMFWFYQNILLYTKDITLV